MGGAGAPPTWKKNLNTANAHPPEHCRCILSGPQKREVDPTEGDQGDGQRPRKQGRSFFVASQTIAPGVGGDVTSPVVQEDVAPTGGPESEDTLTMADLSVGMNFVTISGKELRQEGLSLRTRSRWQI